MIVDRLARQALRVCCRESAHVLDQRLESTGIYLHGPPRIRAHPLTRNFFDQLSALVAIRQSEH
ncbi:MAG TPA: hypothetical protein VM713_09495, partial [Steroidobacteraceae bacterium]|nr:hypothetical protein [Steroidobacteraceae bacterium]